MQNNASQESYVIDKKQFNFQQNKVHNAYKKTIIFNEIRYIEVFFKLFKSFSKQDNIVWNPAYIYQINKQTLSLSIQDTILRKECYFKEDSHIYVHIHY